MTSLMFQIQKLILGKKVRNFWKVMAEVNEALDLANDESECALV